VTQESAALTAHRVLRAPAMTRLPRELPPPVLAALLLSSSAGAALGCTVERPTPSELHDASGRIDAATVDAAREDVWIAPPDALPDAPTDTTCASRTVTTRQVTPNVIVIVDQSASMNEDFGGVTRWDALRDALLGVDGPIARLDGSIRFGWVTYTDVLATAGCPDLVTLPAALGNFDAIATAYRLESPLPGLTPTGAAIARVLAQIATLAPSRIDPTVLIVATDGEPNTCADAYDLPGGRRESLDAITSAYTMGIETFVVSVGTEITTPHLQALANAGQGRGPGDPPADLWIASDVTGLDTALSTIVAGITSCELELDGSIADLARACEGTVGFDGDPPLVCGDGWRAIDQTHIELLGAACDRLLATDDAFHATFPCDVVVF